MNLDELRTVQSKERSKDSLQHLRESFYSDVADYVADLRERRDRAAERADDPFADPEVTRLTDEIQTAEEVVEGIYERRVGKVVKRASLAAMGVAADAEGLTAEEQTLYDQLVERIETNKRSVLDVLAGDEAGSVPVVDADSTPTPDDAASAPNDAASAPNDAAPAPNDAAPTSDEVGAANTSPDADVSAADVMGGDGSATESTDSAPESAADSASATHSAASDSSEGSDAPDSAESGASGSRPNAEAGAVVGEGAATDSASADAESVADSAADSAATGSTDSADADDPLAGLEERTTVRVTDDVGEIFGVDERTYDLASEDVVTLPEANAEPLVERGAAEELD